MSYQTLILVGNLGRDPELRYTPGGEPVCSMNVATNRQYTNRDGETVKETSWFRVSAWGKQAENCSTYLKKGSAVLVEGRLNVDPATGGPKVYTKTDGSSGASFEVTANTVRFLSGGNHGDAQPEAVAEVSSEIPF